MGDASSRESVRHPVKHGPVRSPQDRSAEPILPVTARPWPHAGGGEATTMNVDTQSQWQRDTDAHMTARPSRSLDTPITAAAASVDSP
jgi:hypothetical protein